MAIIPREPIQPKLPPKPPVRTAVPTPVPQPPSNTLTPAERELRERRELAERNIPISERTAIRPEPGSIFGQADIEDVRRLPTPGIGGALTNIGGAIASALKPLDVVDEAFIQTVAFTTADEFSPFFGGLNFTDEEFDDITGAKLLRGELTPAQAYNRFNKDYQSKPFKDQLATSLLSPTNLFIPLGAAKKGQALVKGIPILQGVTEAAAAPLGPHIIKQGGQWLLKSKTGNILFKSKSLPRVQAQAKKFEVAAEAIAAGQIENIAERRLRQLIPVSKEKIEEIKKLRKVDNAHKFGRFSAALAQGRGLKGFQDAMGHLAGKTEVERFVGLDEILTPNQIDGLVDSITRHPDLISTDKLHAFEGLARIREGIAPQASQLRELEKVFPGLTESVKTVTPADWRSIPLGVWDAARTIKSSFDYGAPFRQGLLALPGHPKEWSISFAEGLKSLVIPKYAEAVERSIVRHPFRELAEEAGISITKAGGELGGREEELIGELAFRIPGLGIFTRASARIHMTFLNKLRMDVFSTLADNLIKDGNTWARNPEVFQELALYVNRLTGRGGLGPLEKYSVPLNRILFSPRLLSSRLTFIMSAVTSGPLKWKDFNIYKARTVRAITARTLVSAFGAGTLVMALAKLNGEEIETDPDSSNFGKIVSGPIKHDIWGGHQQLFRFLAQLKSEQQKSAATGDIRTIEREEVLARFVRSKLVPSLGAAYTAFSGENFIGDPVDITTVKGVLTVVKEAFLPMSIEDFWDAFEEMGPEGFGFATPGLFGVGQTVYTTLRDIGNKLAPKYGAVNWEAADNQQRFDISRDPEYVVKLDAVTENVEDLDVHLKLRDHIESYQTRKEDLELELLESIDARGGVKRRRINNYKRSLMEAHEALLADRQFQPLFEASTIGQPLREQWRRRYYDVPLEWNPFFEQPDFRQRGEIQADVLASAEMLGIDPAFILKQPPYRGNHPEVDQMIAEYDADMDALRDYWDSDLTVLKDFGMNLEERAIWSLYRVSGDPEVRDKNLALISLIERAYAREKELMFRNDPEIQRLLIKWQFRKDLR